MQDDGALERLRTKQMKRDFLLAQREVPPVPNDIVPEDMRELQRVLRIPLAPRPLEAVETGSSSSDSDNESESEDDARRRVRRAVESLRAAATSLTDTTDLEVVLELPRLRALALRVD